MQIRVQDRYLYFFTEPNVVLVYQINMENYATRHSLFNSRPDSVFTIYHTDDFPSFHHKKSTPVTQEGFTYIFNVEMIDVIVEKINQQIHNFRISKNFYKNKKQIPAFHIVCSDSAAGSLRVALHYPKKVISFPVSLSIGPLGKLEDKAGQAYRNEWLYDHINFEGEFEYETLFTISLYEIADIPENIPIYIWYADNANEQTGIRFIFHLIKNKANDIYLIHVNNYVTSYNVPREKEEPLRYTSQLQASEIKKILEKCKGEMPVSKETRLQFQKEWEILSQTKGVLHIWENNKIRGVAEDYYDPLIINTLERMHKKQEKKDFIKTGKLIGEMLQQADDLDSSYLEYRVRQLVYDGILMLKGVPKSMRHYRVQLRS
ncbi:DUF1835 domain-containing protein [Bacillaceae bacterium Marseille-Q3522]|nr:DUF1835 domain-containing protein [Bacillaceae bacterium Marseille-Q3522]